MRRIKPTVLIALLVLLNVWPTCAQTPGELATLMDPIVAERMEKSHIPGAVLSIVKDGKIIFIKGYGVADVEQKSPVVPDKTIFRIGSVTAVFTATAVVQMAD